MTPTVLKLVSGETIIADVKQSETPDCVEINSPMIMRTGVTASSKLVVSLMPWMETDETVFTLKENHIISKAIPTKNIKDYYNHYKNQDVIIESIDNDGEDEDEYLEEDLDEERKLH